MIKNNLKKVKEDIEKAAKIANKSSEDIILLAVTKTHPISDIKALLNEGVLDLGENRVQELVEKYDELNDKNINWHQIGHLQRNKVKYIIDKVCLVQSLDSLRLAKELSKRAKQNELDINVLVQINIANEESKFGIDFDDCEDFINELSKLSNIKIKGLMCIAPHPEDANENRDYFKKMNNEFIRLSKLNINNCEMKYLSMGMSNDYIVAIEEGSNLVRIGSKIFGERDY